MFCIEWQLFLPQCRGWSRIDSALVLIEFIKDNIAWSNKAFINTLIGNKICKLIIDNVNENFNLLCTPCYHGWKNQ
jgi:hypothetical protein